MDADPDSPRQPAVSVIVPALNEEAVIARCLESLAAQTLPLDEFEVIVVDNGSRDRSVEIALRFRDSLRLRVLKREGVRISALRNFGAAAARGRFLAFLDADCIAPPDWLSHALQALRGEGCGVIGAHYTIPPGSSWVARTWYEDLRTRKRGRVSYVPAGTLLIGRELFFEVGGFDETIETSEDCEFCQRVSAAGFPVEAIPALSTVHLGTPQTVAAFYRKQRWHGTNVHTVFLRNMLRPSSAKSTLYALYTLCCLVMVTAAGLIALLFHNYAPLSVATLLLFAAPALLAMRAAASRKRWTLLFPLAFLYFVYGFARGLCLLGLSSPRRAAPAAASVSGGPFPAAGRPE
jgi:glycosyltransferase involved in cell wall biosynthesis